MEPTRKGAPVSYEDGVYVDVSMRNGVMTMGFAVVKTTGITLRSCRAIQDVHTSTAELEAVQVAHKVWPGLTVYSDYKPACAKWTGGATYVPRDRNRLAHSAAFNRKNFVSRVALGL